jgi:proline iminopeptidase
MVGETLQWRRSPGGARTSRMESKPHPVKDPLTWLYPALEPHRTGRLKVAPPHELYWEESGDPRGKPALFLHGGPGGGTDPKQRRFFHPDRYRIVLFDQRGCGQSTPHAELAGNSTWDLVRDIEALREHLGIDRWLVFGGSWGSTLALAYAQEHPERVTELVLRGIFMLRPHEITWFYQGGASMIFPDFWEPYRDHIPEAERGDMLAAYHRRLTSPDPARPPGCGRGTAPRSRGRSSTRRPGRTR